MKGFSQLKRISLTLISLLGSYLIFFSASLIAQRAMYVHLNGSTVRLEIILQKKNFIYSDHLVEDFLNF